MSYIGQQLPADTFQGFVTDSFTGDGSATTFTLSKEPFSEDTLIVVINNVIQQPGTNFTVSGTTLTIVGTAVANGDPIYAIHMGGPLPIGEVNKLDLNGGSDQLILDADADTTISADTDDQVDIKIGGTDEITMSSSGIVVNEGSNDRDLRVESNGNDHMLFVDGGNDCVNIGASNDRGGMLNVEGNGGVVIRVADNSDALKVQCTDTDASVGPILTLERTNNSAADADFVGAIVYKAQNDANEATEYAKIDLQIDDASDGTEDGQLFFRSISAGTLRNRMSFYGASTVINDDSADVDLRVESNDFPRMFQVDAAQNEVQVTDSSSFYDTDSRFSVRTTGNNRAVHFSTSDGSYSNRIQQIALEPEESSSAYFLIMNDYNDDQITFRGDGNGFFDGAADAGNADFAEYFESTDGSAIAIGKTVVLDNGKVRASTDSDNASDIVGVVRHRKTVGVIGNSAWSKWKGKYKTDDYGVPLRENYTITKWVETYTEDKKNCTITHNGNTQTFDKVKGEKREHSYQTDKIPSEVTVPSDATVVDVDYDGNKLTRKILSDSYDASKTYVSREDRDEWNLIGLTGQVTMTKGQKTGDRWIKMRDISDTVEEWLIR
jgi:hypothetical protein